MTGPRAVVLGYHDIDDGSGAGGFGGPWARRYTTDVAAFREHLGHVAAAGLAPTIIRDVPDLRTGGTVSALTFDDGGSSAMLAADVLEEHGWRGHFFVVTSLLGSPGFLDPGQVAELAARGHVVGTHSHTHPGLLASLGTARIVEEWSTSVRILSDLLGAAVTTGSLPGGSISPTVLRHAAAAGVRVLFSSVPTSQVSFRDGFALAGRYQLYGTDTARTVGALAFADPMSRMRRRAAWVTRRATQRLLGAQYLRLRQKVLGRAAGEGR